MIVEESDFGNVIAGVATARGGYVTAGSGEGEGGCHRVTDPYGPPGANSPITSRNLHFTNMMLNSEQNNVIL